MTVPVHVLASDVDQQKAAPLGLFILILLGVACYFLFKSMSGHLRRVRDDFPAGGFAVTDGATANGDPQAHAPAEPVIVSTAEGLRRPAPVTLTRSRASEPQRVDPGPVSSRVIEPRAIEPQVDEPQVIEPDDPNPT